MPKTSANMKPGQAVPPERGPQLDFHEAAKPTVENDQSPDLAALLKQYGITTVPKAVYEWGGYRYSSPGDAIAAAKRAASA